MEIVRNIVWRGRNEKYWRGRGWQGYPVKLIRYNNKLYWSIDNSLYTWSLYRIKKIRTNVDQIRNRLGPHKKFLFLNPKRKVCQVFIKHSRSLFIIPFRRSDL